MVRLKATNTKTGEVAEFGLEDLYGYEGEVSGVILTKPNWVIVYNEYGNKGLVGINPDLDITVVSE